jgi:hypothetical protein
VDGGSWHKGWRAACGLLVAVLMLAIAPGCGSGSSDDDASAADEAGQTAPTPKRTTGPTEAILRPVGEMKAKGHALYIKKPDGTPFIVLRGQGLKPASGDHQYIVWQKHSRDDMVLLATWVVGKNQRLSEEWAPSSASLAYLEDGLRTKLLITRIELNDRLYEAGASENSYVHHVIGRPVLEGQFEGALVGATEG